MEYKEIQELIKLINKTSIAEFKLENDNFKLSIRTKEFTESKKQQIVPVQAAPVQAISPQHFTTQAVNTAPPASEKAEAPAKKSKAAKEESEESKYITIISPMVGTFYRSPAPEKPSFVKVGDKVDKKSVVCIVEAMKLFNEIESEVEGTIVKVLIDDASPVEYEQPLFLVDPGE